MSRSRPPKCPNGRTHCICRDRVGARARAVAAASERPDIVDGIERHEDDRIDESLAWDPDDECWCGCEFCRSCHPGRETPRGDGWALVEATQPTKE
jgi:hypothetical protein